MANNKFKLNKLYNKPLSIILLHGTTKDNLKRHGTLALTPVYGLPLVVYQVNLLRSIFPYGDLIIVSGENIEVLEGLIENVRLIESPKDAGSAYAVLAGMRVAIDSPMLVIHGDNFFTDKVFEGFVAGTSTLIYNESPPEIGIISDNFNFAEHLFYTTGKNWCEIMLLDEKELKLYRRLAAKSVGELNFELINKVIDAGGKFTTKYSDGDYLHLKSFNDIKYLRNL